MNIGIDARMYGPHVGGGGLGRYVEQLVTELQVVDHKNRYVLFLKKENFDACVITNPNFEKRLADVHWYTFEEQRKMEHIIDREHLDLVHFPHWNIPLFVRTPFVVTIHDLILLDEPYSSKISTRHQTIFALKYWGYKLVLSHAVSRAKKIIAVSHATANSILRNIENIDPKKIDVVYEGVTALGTSPNPSFAGGALPGEEPGLPSRKAPPAKEGLREVAAPYLLYVGNAYPHKNLERLLEGFKILQGRYPHLKLILAGRESAFYKKLLAGSWDSTHTGITFIKNPSDTELAKLYQGATLYVYPSRVEGFGLPPLEAMSFGVPVAASNIPSLKEILGDAAVYFKPNDSQNIATILADLLDSPEKQTLLIKKGTEQIKRYSWHNMAIALQTLYETCGKKRS